MAQQDSAAPPSTLKLWRRHAGYALARCPDTDWPTVWFSFDPFLPRCWIFSRKSFIRQSPQLMNLVDFQHLDELVLLVWMFDLRQANCPLLLVWLASNFGHGNLANASIWSCTCTMHSWLVGKARIYQIQWCTRVPNGAWNLNWQDSWCTLLTAESPKNQLIPAAGSFTSYIHVTRPWIAMQLKWLAEGQDA